MPLHQLKISTVVISLVICLGLLLAGQLLYEKYYLRENIYEELWKVVKFDEIRIEKQEKPPTVYLRTSQAGNLQVVYQDVEQVVKQQLGPQYRIVFQDERTPELQTLYENCQFAIQEAMVTGGFRQMQQTVRQLAGDEGVDCRLFIDSSNVYLALSDRKGYLYEIIPRASQMAVTDNGNEQGGGEL